MQTDAGPKPSRPRRLLRALRGAALTEMGIAVGLISVMSIGAVFTLGGQTKDIFCTAAGTLSKANGGDGYCLGEMTAVDAVIQGPVFEDMSWPAEQSGQVFVAAKLADPLPAAAILSMAPGGAPVEACYEAGSELTCGPSSSESGTSELLLPEGTSVYGYRITMPTDKADALEDLMDISLVSSDESWARNWTIALSRAAAAPGLGDLMAFEDQLLEAGESFARRRLSDFDSSLAVGDFTLAASARGGMPVAACWVQTVGASTACTGTDTAGASISLSSSQYRLGYEITAPEGVSVWEDFEDTIDVTMTSDLDASLSKSWEVSVIRPALVPVMDLDLEFADVTLAEGATPSQVVLELPQINELVGTYGIYVDGNGQFDVSSCYRSNSNLNFGSTICGDWGDTAAPNVGLHENVAWVGYRFRAKDGTYSQWEDFAGDIDVRVQHDADPNLTKEWSVHVSRPGKTPALELGVEFEDIVVAAGDQIQRTILKAPEVSQLNGYMGIEVDGKGVFDVKACFRYREGGAMQCSAWGDTGNMNGYSINATFYQIGFAIRPKSDSTAIDFDETVGFKVFHKADTTVGKSWDVRVTRPAVE